MTFAALHYLWFFAVIILLIGFGYWIQRQRQKKLGAWIESSQWSSIIPEFSFDRFKKRWILNGIGMVLIALSLLRPQWGEHEELIESHGMDLMFVLDLSNSMLSEDVNPSRLNRAQSLIKKTLSQLAEDRVGVVGFAGRAFLAIPLTTDFGYVSEVVESLNPSAILEQGTEIGEAIEVSIKAFERGGSESRKTSRAIILISDGEDFGKDADKVASKIKDFETGFFAFSVGSPEGAPIPIRNESGILQTYKKDRSGKTVLSKPNAELLSRIAASAGGKFFELTNTDDASYVLTKQLLSFNRESTKEQRQITKIDRYQIFLGLGLLFLIAGFSLGYRRRIRGIALVVLVSAIFTPPGAWADSIGAYLKNRKGIQEYENQKYEDASRVFEGARTEDADNPLLQFNQGTALARSERKDEAIYHLQESTQKALNQGDFETAAKSLYNEGVIQKENKNFSEAFQRLTNAVEMAKISKQPEVERLAREALLQASQEHQKQKKEQQKNESGGSGNNDSKKEQQKDQKKDEPNNQDQKDQKQNTQKIEDGKRREFKSGTLSKDVAEGIMNDLSDREKQLYQKRMKDKKSREAPHEKDW